MALEQQVLMLTEELKSQKVSPSPFLGTPFVPTGLLALLRTVQYINLTQHGSYVIFRGQLWRSEVPHYQSLRDMLSHKLGDRWPPKARVSGGLL